MTARQTGVWFALLAAWLFAACDASDVAVFSDALAGGAGSSGSRGSSDAAGSADAAGNSDDAGSVAGATGGARGSVAGSGGAPAGGTAAGDAGASNTICHSNADCETTSFCFKKACAEVEGTCLPKPMVCFNTAPDPVCGCNHMIYWNDCLRQQYGVAASTPGECLSGAHSCYTSGDCSNGATCSHLLGPDTACGGPLNAGACWVTPSDCAATGDARLWSSCLPPGNSSGGGQCVSTCRAIQIGRPFIQLTPGEACP